jgi:hypothetical protein
MAKYIEKAKNAKIIIFIINLGSSIIRKDR